VRTLRFKVVTAIVFIQPFDELLDKRINITIYGNVVVVTSADECSLACYVLREFSDISNIYVAVAHRMRWNTNQFHGHSFVIESAKQEVFLTVHRSLQISC